MRYGGHQWAKHPDGNMAPLAPHRFSQYIQGVYTKHIVCLLNLQLLVFSLILPIKGVVKRTWTQKMDAEKNDEKTTFQTLL